MTGKGRYNQYLTYLQPVLAHPGVRSSAPHIFSLLAVIFFIVFVIRPTIFTISELQKEISTKNKLSHQLDQKIQTLQAAQANLESLPQATRDKINQAIPLQAEVVDLVSNIQDPLGQNSSPSAQRLSDKTASASAALQIQPATLLTDAPLKYPFTLSEVGFTYNEQSSYEQALTIIDDLKKAARLLNLDSITLNKTEDGLLSVSVSGKGYFLEH